jgi:hypothetical protein
MFARIQRVLYAPLLKYNEVLERKPLLTKAITTGVMYGGGDLIAQYVENMNEEDKEKKKNMEVNYKRLAVFTLFGLFIGGPAFHYWYNYLNEVPAILWTLKKSQQKTKILRAYAYLKSFGIEVILDKAKLPKTAPLGKWQNKLVKLVADQGIFASAYLLVFFMGVGTMTKAVERAEVLYAPERPEIADRPASSEEAAEMISKARLNNPMVADLIAQLEDHLVETEELLGDADDDLKYQYSLINKIFHKIRAVEEIKDKQLSWELIVFNAWQHTKEVYLKTYMVDCLFWPPLQLINFTFVPVRFQFLFVNTVSLFWNTFLSLMANNKGH